MDDNDLTHGIRSGHAKVPLWLKVTYILLPIWGIISFFLYWNGEGGFLSHGYWGELQKAANTKFPTQNEKLYRS